MTWRTLLLIAIIGAMASISIGLVHDLNRDVVDRDATIAKLTTQIDDDAAALKSFRRSMLVGAAALTDCTEKLRKTKEDKSL